MYACIRSTFIMIRDFSRLALYPGFRRRAGATCPPTDTQFKLFTMSTPLQFKLAETLQGLVSESPIFPQFDLQKRVFYYNIMAKESLSGNVST